MQGNRQKITVITVSVLGMVILHGYSLQLSAEEIALADANEHMGETVRISGFIIDLTFEDSNSHITLRQENASIRVFLDVVPDIGIRIGDSIEIIGEIIAYQGTSAMSCSDPSSIMILKAWDEVVVTIPSLSADPWAYRDRNVNLSCRIAYPLSDREGYGYAFVEDPYLENYSIPVFVYGVPVQRLYAGALAFVNARFEYLRTSLGFGLIIDSEEHHIWSEPSNGTRNSDL